MGVSGLIYPLDYRDMPNAAKIKLLSITTHHSAHSSYQLAREKFKAWSETQQMQAFNHPDGQRSESQIIEHLINS